MNSLFNFDKRQKMITIFTPTYNRAYILPKLYESLCLQTNKDFEWLIVDDGSTDDTRTVVGKFIQENKMQIDYQYKQNGGLNSAYNYAVAHSQNEIFFRVDSDDSILPDAIERIYENWHLVKNEERLCGLVFLSQFDDGRLVGTHPFSEITECDFFSYRSKFHAKGDRAEVMKTSVLKNYPFPKFKGEKFCPEGLMWNRIAQHYTAFYIPNAIYVREYMADSITSSVVKTLKKNAVGASLYYAELLKMNPSFFYFFKNSLLFWRYGFFNKKSFAENCKSIPFLSTAIGLMPALLVLAFDKVRGR